MSTTHESATLIRLFERISGESSTPFEDFFTPDARYEFPFSPDGYVRLIEGSEQIAAFLTDVQSRYGDFRLKVNQTWSVEGSTSLFVTYSSSATFLRTGHSYQNSYIGRFDFVGPLISSIVEYYNPMVILEAAKD